MSRFFSERSWQVFSSYFAVTQQSGYRLQSLSLSGDPTNPDVASVWMFDELAPLQELSPLMRLWQFRNARELKQLGSQDAAFFASVRGIVDDELVERCVAVWEAFSPDLAAPVLINAGSFDVWNGALYDAGGIYRHMFARSIDVMPAAGPNQPAVYTAMLWPHGRRRFGWMVSELWANDIQEDESMPRVRGIHTEALAVGYHPWMMVPVEAKAHTRVVVLWRDVLFHPWTKEPFDRSADRQQYLRTVTYRKPYFDADLGVRLAAQQEPLAVGTVGYGNEKVYSAIYVDEDAVPLARKFIFHGVGNGLNAVQAPTQVPGSPPRPRFERSGLAPRLAMDDVPVSPEEARRAERALLPTMSEGDGGPVPLVERESRAFRRRLPRARFEDAVPRGGPGSGGGWGPGGGGGIDWEDPPEDTPQLPGSGGVGPVGGGLGTSPGTGVAVHPVDQAMMEMMFVTGARSAQVAMLRNGKGVFLRTYTLAEEGYPVIRMSKRMRWGSCSKALTPTVLAPYYMRQDASDPWVGLRSSLATELNIDRPNDWRFMNMVSVVKAMQQRTGIPSEPPFYRNRIYEAARGEPAPVEADKALRAGDMRLALLNWQWPAGDPQDVADGSLVTDGQQVRAYNNFIPVALCELMGGRWGGGWTQYVDAVLDELLPEELKASLTTVLTGAGYGACLVNDEVAYHPARPLVKPATYDPLPLILTAYRPNPAFGAGAGFWALSAREMALILRQLSNGANSRFPTYEEKRLMADHEIGWNTYLTPFRFVGDAVHFDATVMHHNGGLEGTSAIIAHVFKSSIRTFDIAASFNSDGAGAIGVELLLAAAQEAESAGLWGPVDLLEGFQLP